MKFLKGFTALLIFLSAYSAQSQTWKTTATTTDWFTAANWSTGVVPAAGTDVIIPVGATNYPVITSGTANAKTITLSTGAGAQPSLTVSGGTLTDANAFTFNAGTVTFSGGTVTIRDLVIAAGMTVNQSGTSLLKITRDWKNSGTFTSTAGTVEFTANGDAQANFATGTNQFFNILVDTGVDPGFDAAASSIISIAGDFTNNNTGLDNSVNATFTFNGTGNQAIYSAATGTKVTFGNLVINNSVGTVSLTSNVNVIGNGTVTAGIFDLSTFAFNRKAAGGTLTVSAGATLKLAGAFPLNFTTGTFASTSTVEFYGTAAQTIPAYNYGNLTTSGARTTTSITYASGTVGVANTFTPNATFTSGSNIITGNTINFNSSGAQTIPAFAYGSLTSSSTGSRTLASSGNVKIAATFTAGTNTYTITGSTVEFNGSTVSTIPVLTVGAGANYNNLVFSGTANAWTMGAAMTIGGNLTISATGSGTVIFNNTASTRTFTLSGNYIQSSGAVNLASSTGRTDIDIAGNIVHTGGTTTFSGSTLANTTFNFNGGGTQTISLANLSSFSYVNYAVASGATLQLASNVNLVQYSSATYVGIFTVNSGGTIIFPAAYSVSMSGGVAGSNPVFNLNSGATMITANASGVDGSVSSTSMTRTFDAAANYQFNGPSGQNTGLVNTTTNNLTANVSGTLNLNTSAAVNGNLTVNSGCTFIPGAALIISGTGTLTGSGTAQVTRTAATPDMLTQYTISNKTLTNLTIEYNSTLAQTVNALNYSNLTVSGARTSNSVTYANSGTVGISGTFSPISTFTSGGRIMTGSTIDFNGTGAQSIPAISYNNLTVSGSASTKTAAGAIVVDGTLTINTSVILDMATYAMSGSLSSISGTGILKTQNTSSTPLPASKTWSGTVEYNGASAQTLVGATFTFLTINNSSGVSMTGNVTVNTTLTLTIGNITTSSYTIAIATGANTSRTSGHVIGNFQKHYAIGSAVSKTFQIGDASNYTPVTVVFGTVSVGGELTVTNAAGDHANIGTSNINASKSVNRTWIITNSGISFDSYNATFTFVAGDIDAGATTSNFIGGKYSGAAWTYPTVGTKTSTTTQLTGITSFGDFQLGEQKLTLSGNIFEDVNYGGGAGRSKASSSGTSRSSARVELYTSAGVYSTFATTDVNGDYSFTGLSAGTYYVRVVNSSVTSSRTGYTSAALPVQTYRMDASSGSASAVTNYVGGTDPSDVDPGNGSTGATFNTTTFVYSAVLSGTAESVTQAVLSSSNITGLDFGFNFNTIVNLNSNLQGSLRRFIGNANLLSNTGLAQSGRTAGIDNAIWMISNGTAAAGLRSANNYFSGGIATITPASALTVITDPVIIDAQTQPGWSAAPIIQVTGTSAGSGARGFEITAGGSTIRGFIINAFTGASTSAGIYISTSGSNTIQGNYIGTNAAGTAASANYQGIYVYNAGSNLIGGTTAAQMNVLSGNTWRGIFLDNGASSNIVKGNYIGLNAAGTSAIANLIGITIWSSPSNSIGGTAAGEGNTISGNTQIGIYLVSSSAGSNTIQGNTIGLNAARSGAVANGTQGIEICCNGDGGSNNMIGGTAAGASNVISGNTGIGVRILGGTGNAILTNAIYGNGGIGIDLGSDNVTANNGTKNASLPNYEMDYPVFTSVQINAAGTTLAVSGYVGSAAGQSTFASARVEIFKSDNDASGNGEASAYLGYLTADASGNFSGSISVTGISAGDKITGTATDGSNNTSEFGVNFTSKRKIFSTMSGGNWSTAGSWVGTVVPTADDLVDVVIGATVTLDANITRNAGDTLTVYGALNTGTYTVSGAGEFTLASGGTLAIGSTAGITSSGATGNIQVTGTRSFSTGANYTYNASSSQATGNGLPATVNNLTINNSAGVNLSSNVATNGVLTLAFGALGVGTNTLSINGSLSASSSLTSSATGTVIYNVAGGQIVLAASYGNLTLANSGTKQFAPGTTGIAGTLSLTGSATADATTYSSTIDFNSTSAQTIPAITYYNLTASGSSSTKTASGNLVVNGTLTSNSNVVLDMATYTLSGTLGTITNNGTIKTQSTSATALPSGKTWAGTVEYNKSTGGQTIAGGTYNNLTNTNTSGTNSAGGNIGVGAALTLNTSSVFDMVSYSLVGALTSVTGTGIMKTQNTSSTPIPSGKTWTGGIEYNKSTGGQTIVAGTYTNLTNSNTSGTNTAAAALTVNGVLTLTASSTLDMVTYALSGSLTSTSGTGTIKTQNTSTTPIPSGKTWTGLLMYNSGAAQTIVYGNYSDLNASGANRTIDSLGTVGIAGTFTPGAGTYAITSSTINFNGSSTQTIPAFTFNNITVSGGSTKSVGGTLNVRADLTVAASTTLALGSNNIKLKSDSTYTARLATFPASASITYGSGRFIAERYIKGRRKYRLMTSAVTTSTNSILIAGEEALSIWGNWQNQANNSTPGAGTFITGGSAGDGFDTQTPNASLFTYNSVGRSFTPFTTANGKNTKYTPLKAGVPYYMFVYGDRTNSAIASSPNKTVLTATGTLLTGDQTYNTGSTIALSNVVGGYTMIGNPFASPIDWSTVSRTNLSNTYWGWDPNLSSTGGYVTVSTTGTVTLISPYSGSVGLNQYIQSGQGFFVKTTATSPVLVIHETDKASNFNPIAFRTEANDIPLMAVNLIYTDASGSTLMDGTLAAFDASFANQVGDEDATKIIKAGEALGIEVQQQLLSIDARKMPVSNDTLFLNVSGLTKPQYSLQIFANKMDSSGLEPYLEDTYLNTSLLLSLTDTNNIAFTVNAAIAASSNVNRFRIVFRQSGSLSGVITSVKAAKENRSVRVSWDISSESAVQKYEIQRAAGGNTFTNIGELPATGISSYEFLDNSPVVGSNNYRIRVVNADGSSFFSRVVTVVMEEQKGEMKIFPNPVSNYQVNIELVNMEQGKYTARLFNAKGQLVMSREIAHSGGTATQLIEISRQAAAGIYFFELTGGKTKYNQTIIIQ